MNYVLRLLCLALCIVFATVEGVGQWKKVTLPTGYASTHWLDVFFLPANPQYGWICGFNGHVLRTTNGGATWLGAQVPNTGNLESIHFVDAQTGYTSGNAGIFKSTDGGVTWVDITPAGDPPLWGCYFVSADIGMVVGGGCGLGAYQFFFRTTDGGQNWSLYLDSIPDTGLTDVMLYSATGLGYAASSGRIWRTNNGGQTWAVIDTSGPAVWNEEITNINSSFLVPVAGSFCGGGGGGGGMLFTTDNGDIWREFVSGVPMFGTFLLNTTTGWACGDNRSVYYTSDGGSNWQLRNCGIEAGDLDDIWFINSNSGWVVGQGVYKYLWPPYDKKTDTLKYSDVCIPDVRLDTAIIYNRNSALASMSVAIGGPDASQFELVSPSSMSIGACDSARVIIRFRPTSTGNKAATASLTFSTGTMNIELRGTGRLPSVTVVDSLVTMNPAQVGAITTGTISWRNTSGLVETISEVEVLSSSSVISLMPGFPPLPIGAFGGTIYVYATPVDTGWTTARYRFRLAPCNTDTTVTVRVYGVSPIITVADTVRLNLSCRSEMIQSIPVANTGNAPLVLRSASLSGANAADFSLVTTFPKTIAPGVTDTVFVRFRPVVPGIRQAVLSFVNNDSTTVRGKKNPRSIALRGAFSKAAFTTSFPDINLGDVCVGDSTEMSVVINGDQIVDGRAVRWSTANSVAFRLVEPVQFPVTLPARQATQFLVRFTPQVAGVYVDTLRIYVEPCDTVFAFTVRGRGIAPAAVVVSTEASASTPTDTDIKLSLSLANVSSEAEQLVAVEPLDNQPAIWFSGGTLPLQIPAGGMPLAFTGNVPDTGWFEARYRVVVQKGQCRRDTLVSVRVYGVSPVLDTRSDVYFVLGTCNESAVDTVYVRNTGNAPLDLGALSAPFGPHAADFTILGLTRSGAVLPGDSVGIVVRFTPSATGERKAAVSFEHNDRRSRAALPHPFVVEFVGDRGFVLVEATPTAADFDTVCIGEQRTVVFRIKNNGTVKAFITQVTAGQEYTAAIPGKPFPVELDGEFVDLEVVFAPKTPGFHKDSIIVSLEPCGERYTFVVEGFAGETRIEATPAALALGDIRTGVAVARTVKLKSVGNLPARIESGAVTLLPARSDVTLTIVSPLPVVLQPGDELEVRIEFTPVTDTVFANTLCVSGAERCPFSLCIPVSAASTSSQLAIHRKNQELRRCPGPVLDTVEVRNIGSGAIGITDITLEPSGTPFSVVSPSTFILQPNEVGVVVLQASLLSDGVYSATLVLHTTTEGKRKQDITLEYRKADISLSAKEVVFGVYERCAGTLEIPVTLTSVGSLPDTVIIRRKHDVAGFSSVPANTVIVPPLSASSLLLRASTKLFEGSGIVRDTFLLQSTACGEYAVAVEIQLVESHLVATPPSLDLGSLEFAAVRDTVVMIAAPVAERRVVGLLIDPPTSNFVVVNSGLPAVVVPGAPLPVALRYAADRQGVDQARLLVVHEGACRDTTVVLLQATVPDNIFRFSLYFDKHAALAGDTVSIPLRYSGSLSRLPLSSMYVRVAFDKWLLQPLSVSAAGVQVPFQFDGQVLSVVLEQPVLSSAEFGRDGAVFVVRGLALSSFPPSTALAFDSVRLETISALQYTTTNGEFTVDGVCEPVARILRRLGIITVHGIAPHPAADKIEVRLHSTALHSVRVEVFDAYGRMWYSNEQMDVAAGEGTLSIDASAFPSGMYFVRIVSPVQTELLRCSIVK